VIGFDPSVFWEISTRCVNYASRMAEQFALSRLIARFPPGDEQQVMLLRKAMLNPRLANGLSAFSARY